MAECRHPVFQLSAKFHPLLRRSRRGLGQLVEIPDGVIDLADPFGLFLRSGGDFLDERIHLFGFFEDDLQAGFDLGADLRPIFAPIKGFLDPRTGLFGGLGTALGQVPYRIRHHRKSEPRLAGTRRLHGSVQGKQIGLEGNLIDGFDDLSDAGTGFLDLSDGMGHPLHLTRSLPGGIQGLSGYLPGLLRTRCMALCHARNLLQGRPRLLQRSRLTNRPLREMPR